MSIIAKNGKTIHWKLGCGIGIEHRGYATKMEALILDYLMNFNMIFNQTQGFHAIME